jgi:hypothetical protein
MKGEFLKGKTRQWIKKKGACVRLSSFFIFMMGGKRQIKKEIKKERNE